MMRARPGHYFVEFGAVINAGNQTLRFGATTGINTVPMPWPVTLLGKCPRLVAVRSTQAIDGVNVSQRNVDFANAATIAPGSDLVLDRNVNAPDNNNPITVVGTAINGATISLQFEVPEDCTPCSP